MDENFNFRTTVVVVKVVKCGLYIIYSFIKFTFKIGAGKYASGYRMRFTMCGDDSVAANFNLVFSRFNYFE